MGDSGRRQGYSTPENNQAGDRFHGATEVVVLDGESLSTTFRIYPNGVRVGCTFVTDKAVAWIVAQLKERGVV